MHACLGWTLKETTLHPRPVLPAIAGDPLISVYAPLQVMFDATMLLAQEYRSMIARAKQRSVQALTAQLQTVSSHPCSSMLPNIDGGLGYSDTID